MPPDKHAQRLPRRDIFLLPAIFLLTWLTIGLAGEVAARIVYPEQQDDRCYITEADGGRYRPNCHSVTKMFESGWIESDYNDCGYRSAGSCEGKAANAIRIAVLGTSISRGYWVPYDQTFAGRVEHDLTTACGRPVDLQNVSQAKSILPTRDGWTPIWHHVVDRVPEALALRPAALVLVVTPFDLALYDSRPGAPTPPAHAVRQTSALQALSRTIKRIKDFLANDSRLIIVGRHISYRDTDRFILHDLQQGDQTDYLRQPFTKRWSLRLEVADDTIGRIASLANAAGVPLIVVMMPERAQAALSAAGVDRHGTDPFAMGRALGAITRMHHADFVDLTQNVSKLQDPANLFYEVNGHPNEAGHAVLAAAVETELLDQISDLTACRPASVMQRAGR